MINVNNKNITGRQITTFLFLALSSITNLIIMIMILFPHSFGMGALFFASIGFSAALITGALIMYNKEVENKLDLSQLNASDYYTMFKLGWIAVALSSSNFMTVVGMLFYEKLPHAAEGSPYRKHNDEIEYRYNQKELEYNTLIENSQYNITKFWYAIVKRWYYIVKVSYYVKQPFAINACLGLANLCMMLLIIMLVQFSVNAPILIKVLSSLPIWLGYYALLRYGTYLVGGSVSSLFHLPTKTATKREDKYGNHARNFKWMLIAFLIASPTIIIGILFPGYLPTFLDLSYLSQMQYVVYCIANAILYSVQPMIEEIVFRVCFYRYCVLEKLCPEDYKDMSLTQKILYSFLNGSLFAFAHQMVRGYTALISFIPLMAAGFVFSMLTFLNGSIDFATFTHAFHNFSISIFPGFLGLWFEAGYEFTQYITPIISESIKYATVVILEEDYCNADNEGYKSTLDTAQKVFAQYVPASA